MGASRWGPLRGVVLGGMAFDEFVERYVAAAGLAIGETAILLTLSLSIAIAIETPAKGRGYQRLYQFVIRIHPLPNVGTVDVCNGTNVCE